MAELFKLMFMDINIMRIASVHLSYDLIPKEWAGYKFLFREAIEQFTKTGKVPSLGVASQKFANNQFVQESIDDIKQANLVDRELLIDQLESYIRETKFELLSKKVYDLYNEGKREEAIQLNAEESKKILEICLRQTGGNFNRVFHDFEERMKTKRTEDMNAPIKRKVTLGIDKLDEISYGGADPGDLILWIMRSGVGKALTLDSDIYTPTGIIKMKDIKVGDEVLGKDGNIQKVIGVYPQGVRDCYKVTFNDGVVVECDQDHLWTVKSKRARKTEWNVLPLKEIMSKGIKLADFHPHETYITKTGNERYGSCPRDKWYIPVVENINFEERKVLIDPYTLGVLMGDGCFRKESISLSNPDQEILERLKLPENMELRHTDKCDYRIATNGSSNSLYHYLSQYGLADLYSYEKFIPNDYKWNTYKTRLEILTGLLDTDGYADQRGGIQLELTSKRLIEDAVFIARSLGCLCREIKEKPSFYTDATGQKVRCKNHFSVNIVPPRDLCLFHLTRKKERTLNIKKKCCTKRTISSIEYIGKKEMQCIRVSNKDGLFITNNFIVTHNSTVLRWHGYAAMLEGQDVLHIQLEGGVEACVDKYDQMWTAQSYTNIRKGNIKKEDEQQIMKTLKDIRTLLQNDISVYGFKKFGEASVTDVRKICTDYQKTYGKFPSLLIVDSLDLLKSGISKKLDDDPDFVKYRLQRTSQLLKDLAVEMDAVVITATQTGSVPIEIWNNEDKVIDRNYTEGDRTLVKPYSFVFTGNRTKAEEKKEKLRIFIDKLRDYKNPVPIVSIATAFDKGRFYHRGNTQKLYKNDESTLPTTQEKPEKITKGRKGKTV